MKKILMKIKKYFKKNKKNKKLMKLNGGNISIRIIFLK